MSADEKLRLFLDASCPDSIGAVFAARRHAVIYHREVLPEGTADYLVCAAALENGAILVAVDADMKALTRRYGSAPESARFKSLNLIRVGCNGPMAAKRVEQAMELVEAEWLFAIAKSARRLWIDVCPHYIRTNR